MTYDKKEDILSIHKGFEDEKFKGNIDAGDIILDLSTKGRIRGIEILDASSFFKDFGLEKLLFDLQDATFEAQIKAEAIMISITLKGANQERPASIRIPVAGKV